jgi:hypothetical protein
MNPDVDMDDLIEAFVGSLLAGLVLLFVVWPIARRFGLRLR